MVLDGDQLLGVPYVGERLRKFNEGIPSARNGKDPSVPQTQNNPDSSTTVCWSYTGNSETCSVGCATLISPNAMYA